MAFVKAGRPAAWVATAFVAAMVAVSAAAERSAVPKRAERPAVEVGPATAEDPGGAQRLIRLFKLAHREPGDAFTLVQPLLSASGQVTVSPKLRLITVQDDEAHLRIVEQAIRQFDVQPKSYRIQVTFYRASGNAEDGKPASAPAQLRGAGKRLADLLRFSQYTQIDDIVVTGEEGATLSARMGGEYAVDFFIVGDPQDRGEVRLRNFRVSRVRKDDRGGEQLSHVFGTSLNLQLEKPFILGATRDEQSRTALLIALNAKRAD